MPGAVENRTYQAGEIGVVENRTYHVWCQKKARFSHRAFVYLKKESGIGVPSYFKITIFRINDISSVSS